ncbi:sigma-70 family RNA polymerase sigma factor [Verrucomicrobia bacterium]|nr:sigma-70 family RNA polymerase sigma factor [Verrucomicrobiota bacterium]
MAGSVINSDMDTTDKELIAEVLEGNPESFEPLVVKYQPRVFAIARRYARREDEVEDIVQTVFMKAYSKLSSYRGDAPFEHWLMRTATFTCYDFLRKHQRNREWNATDLSTEENEWLENVGGDTTEKEANQSAAKALVDRLLESLKPDDRMIITMLDLEQKSVKEIAKLTDFTESNVKVRAHRARDKMKKILATLAPQKYL